MNFNFVQFLPKESHQFNRVVRRIVVETCMMFSFPTPISCQLLPSQRTICISNYFTKKEHFIFIVSYQIGIGLVF
jgi:hypothetical protein